MGDNTTHTIRHIDNVPLSKGNNNYIKNVLHVLTIMKNLVLVSQIVEQGMQVRFNNGGYFIEKNGRLIARGWREGQMFVLNLDEVKSAMYARGRREGNVCQRFQNQYEYQVVAQENRPHQHPTAPSYVIEGSS